ncbi:glutathione S-transferase [Shewanella sp. NFH-SH190041]|uniref:glutathione S-transferase family protein n=1 Tax=Shewanella sp. NFH-SH190041 TaxID=2950245 RepID=UPI0021C3EF8C|nr:glutathione S-transferase family protein [Shewanella sp. NFH-SH190041]BDM65682.1 glutathione S-transferase [Shewanella sp. NFH-SH190041]
MITLYGMPRSRSLRVSWLLEELELDWHYHFIDAAKGEHRSDAYLAINPCGKVPALTDDELVLTESAAIMLYLARKYGNGDLLPAPGTPESAKQLQWVSFIITELEQPLWTIGKHKFALPAELRCSDMINVAQYEFEQAAAIAENWLPQSPFLLGDELSVADLLLAHTLLWGTRFNQTISPALAQYRDRLAARPALARALNKELTAAGQTD